MLLMPPNPLTPPIRTDGSNAFAEHTVKVRLPDILDETLEAMRSVDAPAAHLANVAALRDEIAAGGLIQMLPAREDATPEYAGWAAACAARAGATWRSVDWFFCETFTYRRLMDAVDYFSTRIDPFAPIKAREYASDIHRTVLDNALAAAHAGDSVQALRGSLHQAVFGNRVDLSYAESRAQGLSTSDSDLLVDDREAVIAHLLTVRGGVVHVVADNAGSELSADLCLIDLLLRHGLARRVVLHTKLHPTFVSDVIDDDVTRFIDSGLQGAFGDGARELCGRLRGYLTDQLVVRHHPYWNSPYFAWQMPSDLAVGLQSAALVIVKGDANYRRFIGDAFWAHETPFADVVSGLGMALLMLRTLKSDPLVGISAGVAEQLQALDERWRWNGKRAVIQFYAPR